MRRIYRAYGMIVLKLLRDYLGLLENVRLEPVTESLNGYIL